jgi:hypothetical protein
MKRVHGTSSLLRRNRRLLCIAAGVRAAADLPAHKQITLKAGRGRHIEERNAPMMKKTVVALALSTGVVLSGPALADPAKFDGTWSVSLVADGGLCGSGASQTLTVQNGSVRAGGSGVSVSGQVGPSGSVSLALQKSGVQGSASGKLSGASGSGSWAVSSLGCSGRWTAQRRTVTAQAN